MKPHIPLAMLFAITACAPVVTKPVASILVKTACTEAQPPSDDSFGATTYSLIDLIGKYRKCRAAALGDTPSP